LLNRKIKVRSPWHLPLGNLGTAISNTNRVQLRIKEDMQKLAIALHP
jgi:hypothetical protein